MQGRGRLGIRRLEGNYLDGAFQVSGVVVTCHLPHKLLCVITKVHDGFTVGRQIPSARTAAPARNQGQVSLSERHSLPGYPSGGANPPTSVILLRHP
jgi:hypothetical protein